MNWWQEYADRMKHDVPLGRDTWFRLGGRARYEFRPHDADDLATMMRQARDALIPLKVLGAGANVLVSDDGFDGVVVRLDADAFRAEKETSAGIEVGAGVELMAFSKRCSRAGWAGLEGLAGIPATIGGAIRTNAGGRFGEIGDVVQSIRVLDDEGNIEEWPRDGVGFRYRNTSLNGRIVLSATLALTRDDPEKTSRRYDECLEYKQRTQPLADNSAGCIFKNPAGQSAGALIDRAGMKGSRYRAARVSERHANFIVAERGATASDVLHLIDMVRDRVYRVFDTELELEIDVWRPSVVAEC
jgi:UDP-N-acetylmuramate dehydrogenase